MAQRLAPARTRTRVVRLGAQCTDHWTTGQSRGVGVPTVQLTTHVKSSTLYGRTAVQPNFFGLDGLLLSCIIMGLRSASSAINSKLAFPLGLHGKETYLGNGRGGKYTTKE